MDPYSHTPAHCGARQPGLTGQVKEDILCRAGELGIVVEASRLCFRPLLLRKAEFLSAPGVFSYYGVAGVLQSISLPKNSLAFTRCQVPIIYRAATTNQLEVIQKDGLIHRRETLNLDGDISHSIFGRDGKVERVTVFLDASILR